MRLIPRGKLIGSALVAAAIAAPGAHAHVVAATATGAVSQPDIRAQLDGTSGAPSTVVEKRVSSALICTPRSEPGTCRVISTTSGAGSTSAFQFDDAAIGAGVMAGLAMLGMAGALPLRRRAQLRHP